MAVGGEDRRQMWGEERVKATRVRRGLTSTTAMTLLVLSGMALPGSMAAHARATKPTVEQLQKEIRQRDAVIRSLVRRVENLERQMGNGGSASASPVAAATRSAARSPAGRPSPAQTEVAALEPEEPAPTRT